MSQSISIRTGDFITIGGRAKNLDITSMTISCGAKFIQESKIGCNTAKSCSPCGNDCDYVEFIVTVIDAAAVGGGLFKMEYDQVLSGNLKVGSYKCDVKIINGLGNPVHTNIIELVVTEGVTK